MIEIDPKDLNTQLRDLNYQLWKAGRHDLQTEMRKTNRRIADDAVVEAKRLVPVDTGTLRRWTRARATAVHARVVSGTGKESHLRKVCGVWDQGA